MTRLVPNSSTSPTRVLNGCPASATSSPMRNTVGSRRISSAIASRTASPYVSSRSPMPALRLVTPALWGEAPLRGPRSQGVGYTRPRTTARPPSRRQPMCQIISDYLDRRVAAPADRLGEQGVGRRDFLKLAGMASVAMAVTPAWAQTGKFEVHWLGQAATKLTSPSGKVIVIDPFITNNPKTPPPLKNLDALGKVDVILVTHGHGDHVGDVKVLAERTG